MKPDASTFKKTKIIATIGPASEEKIPQLLEAGVNGVRLNFSHGTHSWHAGVITKTREAAKKLDRSVAIIVDLQGPKIRLGSLPNGGVELGAGQKISFCYGEKCQGDVLPIQFDFSELVKKGDRLFLRDGTIKTTVLNVKDKIINVEVNNSGKVSSNHGINLPDTVFDSSSILTQKDRRDLEFVFSHDIDYVALSFVQTQKDITYLRKLLNQQKSLTKIIAKIETRVATKNLEEIITSADAVMIARGDLAIETSNEDVPLIGREIITLARKHRRPAIMATQMLESMISSPQPTRAEVNDISSAVQLGVSCVMLSGETATGQYPVEVIQLMKRVILKSEMYFSKTHMEIDMMPDRKTDIEIYDVESIEEIGPLKRIMSRSKDVLNKKSVGKLVSLEAQRSVSLAAITLAEQVGAKLILAETLTGSTALSLAALRPPMPIIIASPSKKVCNQTAIVWGGKPYLVPKAKTTFDGVVKKLISRGSVSKGDWIVIAFGKYHGVAGGTDTVRLLEI